MNLFISSSKYRQTGVPCCLGIVLLIAINLGVACLPEGVYRRQFEASILISRLVGEQASVILFGDSRATRFKREFFRENTLSFASPNNTVVYSKLLFDRILSDTKARPKVMIITLGANNYNKNGIFPLRDFAIRQLVSFADIRDFASYRNSYGYMIDALFAKMFPIYGRRMEIRSPSSLLYLFQLRQHPLSESDVPGHTGHTVGVETMPAPERSAVFDQNYWLIYKRSVYCNYELSTLHTGMLERLIDTAIQHGMTVVTLQLPIEPKMRQLEIEMVGSIFDDYLERLRTQKSIIHLDLRDDLRFEFYDLNHLSLKGASDLTREVLNPLIEDILSERR